MLRMASRRLPKHLHATLGSEAGEEFMTILDEIRADGARREASFQVFRHEVIARFEHMDQRFTTLEVTIADVMSDLMKWSFCFLVRRYCVCHRSRWGSALAPGRERTGR